MRAASAAGTGSLRPHNGQTKNERTTPASGGGGVDIARQPRINVAAPGDEGPLMKVNSGARTNPR